VTSLVPQSHHEQGEESPRAELLSSLKAEQDAQVRSLSVAGDCHLVGRPYQVAGNGLRSGRPPC